MLLRLKPALLYSPRSQAVAETRNARVGLGQVAERWLCLQRSYSVREQTSADGPWELHSSAKHSPGRGSAGHFPMGHQAWGAGELAAPGGKGAQKSCARRRNAVTRTRGGNAVVVVPVAAVLGREAAGCPPGCPVPAKGSGLYSRHLNADQASLCFHSNCESFGLLIHKRPGPCHFTQDAHALQVNDRRGCSALLGLGRRLCVVQSPLRSYVK